MVKAIYSSNSKGLRDWVIQHMSAFIMALYVVTLVLYLVCNPKITYTEWHAFFDCSIVKISTIVVFFLLLYHAWIGIWTVITDYVKCSILRLTLYTAVLLLLMTLFLALLFILWGV